MIDCSWCWTRCTGDTLGLSERGKSSNSLVPIVRGIAFVCLCHDCKTHALPASACPLLSQQLNFYSFRKVKYVDTIRIDPKLEAETANYWRFRHENFRQGRPDLLSEIKRTNGQKAAEKKPETVTSTSTLQVDSEVLVLKKRIEEMHKNIDSLTAMVSKVNLKQEEQEKEKEVIVANKRKKVDPALPELVLSETCLPDPTPSSLPEVPVADAAMMIVEESIPVAEMTIVEEPQIRPDEMVSSMSLDDFAAMPLPDPAPLSRELTESSNVTDNEFVDTLFTQFGDDEVEFINLDEPEDKNQPDPELMQRLSDALMVLPREIQEMIVERLIQSITSPDFEKNLILKAAAAPAVEEVKFQPKYVVAQKAVPVEMDAESKQREVAVPLAAATLAALLQHLCQQAEDKEAKSKTNTIISKILPVVPVHA